MNVYDFDKTIYKRDSNVDFYFYCLGRRPWLIVFLPVQLSGLCSYMLGKADLTRAKSRFMSYVRHLPDAERYAREFWDKKIKDIYPWYTEQKDESDVIISASPDFLLKPACDMLGVKNLIASQTDPRTGEFAGANNRGAEKPKRFYERFGDAEIDSFYSDSISDEPMACLAKRAFLIHKGRILPWYGTPATLKQRIREKIFGR